MKHRIFGGSTAARTMACPGWRQESEGLPKGGASEYAAEGTALHNCMEEMLMDENLNPEDFLGKVYVEDGFTITITQDHVHERLTPALEAFEALQDKYNTQDYEPEVEADYATDIGGYSDVVLWSKDAFIVLDWKFGQGIMVSPFDNPQGKFYGMAVRKNSSVAEDVAGKKKFVFAIIQPNTKGEDTLRTWEAPMSAIDQFEAEHQSAVIASTKEDPPLKSGDHCKYCPAAALCPEKNGQAQAALLMDLDDLEILGEAMTIAKQVESWAKEVKAKVTQQLNDGAIVPGWKLVNKKPGNRQWIDEDQALKTLRRKLGGAKNIIGGAIISPAKVEAVAKAQGVVLDLSALTHKPPSSGHTIAEDDDKRAAVPGVGGLKAALASVK